MKLNLKYLHLCFLPALAFGLFLVNTYLNSCNIELEKISDGIFGIATKEMVDVNKRISLFYRSIYILISVFLGYLIIFCNRKFTEKKSFFLENLKTANFLASLCIILMAGNLFLKNGNEFIQPGIYLLIISHILLLTNLVSGKRIFYTTELIVSQIYVLGMLFAIREYHLVIYGVFNISFFKLLILNIISFSIIILLNTNKIPYSEKVRHKIRNLFILFGSQIPLLVALNSVILFLAYRINIETTRWFIWCILILITISYDYFRTKSIKSLSGILKRSYLNILLGAGIFVYINFSFDTQNEMFELANPANAALRIFKFGQIPFLEYLSSHLLSEQAVPFLINILTGFKNNTDFIFFQDTVYIIIFLAGYYAFSKLFSSKTIALFICLLFPYTDVLVVWSFCLIFFSIIFLLQYFAKPSKTRLYLILLWTFFLICWKIETGYANLIATILTYTIYIIANRNIRNLKFTVRHFAIFTSIVFTIVSIIIIFKQIPIFDNIHIAFEYLNANQAHGYPVITYNKDIHYYFHYFIFPAFIIPVSIFILVKSKFRNFTNSQSGFYYLTLAFTLVIYVINFQRGLIRHSHAEGVDMFGSSLAYFIIFLILSNELLRYKGKTLSINISLIIVSLIIIISKFSVNELQSLMGNNITNLQSDHLFIQKNLQFKKITEKNNSFDIVKFLDNKLDENQTFLDFTNSPMLYFYTGRPIPSYFNQFLQNVVTEKAQDITLKQFDKYDMPLVIFSHIPPTFYDQTDGIPNSLRYFKIAQYIFKNFEPYLVVGGYNIWRKVDFHETLKTNSLNNNRIIDSLVNHNPETFDLGYIPQLLKINHLDTVYNLIKNDTINNTICLPVPSILKEIPELKFNNYLSFNIHIKEEIPVSIKYYKGDTINGIYKFRIKPVNDDYKDIQQLNIPMSSQYYWFKENDSICIFLPGNPVHISKIELIKAQTLEN